jgi:hypothetical protein
VDCAIRFYQLERNLKSDQSASMRVLGYNWEPYFSRATFFLCVCSWSIREACIREGNNLNKKSADIIFPLRRGGGRALLSFSLSHSGEIERVFAVHNSILGTTICEREK